MSTTAKAPTDRPTFLRVLLPLGALACLLPWVSPGVALLAGSAIGLAWGNPFARTTRKVAQKLLMFSVVGLGAGVDLHVVLRAGAEGVGVTALSIVGTIAVGSLLARMLGVEARTGLLISIGTAICGGSAIAAVAPPLRAKEHEITVALATVFLLNAVALFIFPPIGRAFGMSEESFGMWAALAIHDTSSVVGASMAYGEKALAIATTVKLARALWIVPITLLVGYFVAKREAVKTHEKPGETKKPNKPWFIAGFLAMAAITTFVPSLRAAGEHLSALAKHAMSATLFLIGAGLTREALKAVGVKPLVQGVVLWLVVAGVSLGVMVAVG